MKAPGLKSKQLLLGLSIAAAVGLAAITYQRSQNRLLSILMGTASFSLAATVAGGRPGLVTDDDRNKSDQKDDMASVLSSPMIKYENGKADEAIEELRDLEETDSELFWRSEASHLLGLLLLEKGEKREAMNYLRQYVKRPSCHENALTKLGDTLLEEGNPQEAVEIYTRLIKNNNNDSRIVFNRGVAYAYQDNLSRAYDDWLTASEMGDEAAVKLVNQFESYATEEVSDENLMRLSKEGKMLQEKGELEKSKVAYDKAINICIQLGRNNKEFDLAKAYQERGTTHLLAGSFSKAVEDYEKAEKNAGIPLPEIAAAYADALSSLTRYKDAISYYNLAIKWKPSQLLYFERALAKTRTNDDQGAILDYATSIDLDEDKELTWKSYINRGCLKAHSDALLEAEQDFLAGLELNPSDIIAREWLARTYSELKRYDEAYEELTKAIDTDSTYWDAYRLRGLLSLSRYEYRTALDDLRKYAENAGEDESVQEKIDYIEGKLKTLIEPSDLLEPSDNLVEWRTAQALLARNAAYIQTYERYLEKLEPGEVADQFKGLIEKLGEEYLNQVRISAKYKNAYCLFRLRNLTYATMAVNMNGERLEDREAFGKYFLHSIFDDADTVLRDLIRGDEIDRQINEANKLEDYVVYGCSCYCNRLLNLIDNDSREERDSGEHFEEFLRIQRDAEERRKVDEIFVVREAMIWTIASTNIDLVTSAEESDAFEVKAFEVLSATNSYSSDYGEEPYRKEDIIDAICNHRQKHLDDEQRDESCSHEEYRARLNQMSIAELTQEAKELKDVELREFLNYWGKDGIDTFKERRRSGEKIEYTIEQLRQAVINDYAYLCYQDRGTQPDETSLEDYKNLVTEMSWEELLEETSVSEDENPLLNFSLNDYMESWLKKSEYADLRYIKNKDGSTSIET